MTEKCWPVLWLAKYTWPAVLPTYWIEQYTVWPGLTAKLGMVVTKIYGGESSCLGANHSYQATYCGLPLWSTNCCTPAWSTSFESTAPSSPIQDREFQPPVSPSGCSGSVTAGMTHWPMTPVQVPRTTTPAHTLSAMLMPSAACCALLG